MSDKPIVTVFTGNSNTGSAAIEYIVDGPLKDKVQVRAIVRKKANAEHLIDMGVDVVVGDVKKWQMHRPLYENTDVCYFATPNTQDRAKLAKSFIDSCMEHGVPYPIILSVLGADEKKTVLHKQFAEIEEYAHQMAGKPVKLNVGDKGKLTLKPIIIRCASFYQNLYGCLSGISSGTFYYPMGDGHGGKMAHVDIADIGKVIAHIMLEPEKHANKTYNLIGEYHSGTQVASAISMRGGIGCLYQEVPDDVARDAFVALGLQTWIANAAVETMKWYREGGGQGIKSDIEEITGQRIIRLQDFVKDNIKPMLE